MNTTAFADEALPDRCQSAHVVDDEPITREIVDSLLTAMRTRTPRGS
jgi:hypothetical protein